MSAALDGLADMLKSLRKSAGLSQEELASKSDVSQQTISKLENGRTEPRRKTMVPLARVFLDLGCKKSDIEELLQSAGLDPKLAFISVEPGQYTVTRTTAAMGLSAAPDPIDKEKAKQAQRQAFESSIGNYLINKRHGLDTGATKMTAIEKLSAVSYMLFEISSEAPELLPFIELQVQQLMAANKT